MRFRAAFKEPWAGEALATASLACAVLASAALVGGAVRLLPWVFDPAVPWRVAAPFARGLASIAIEAAVLVGWPVGWTLAAVRIAENGEARALQALGEPPAKTVLRLLPQALLFAGALAGVAIVWGRDASAPGRVATELVSQARASCERAARPTTYAIPFTELTWLCAPGATPRLTGGTAGSLAGLGGTTFTATDARIAGDFRRIELDDARLALAPQSRMIAKVSVDHLVVRGLAPWSHASTLTPAMRAIVMALAGALAASLATIAALYGAVRGRIGAIVVGAAGPLSALGALRALERMDARPALFVLAPVAAALGVLAAALVLDLVRRGRLRRRAALAVRK